MVRATRHDPTDVHIVAALDRDPKEAWHLTTYLDLPAKDAVKLHTRH